MVTLGQILVSQVLTNFLSFGPNFGQASADGLWEGIFGPNSGQATFGRGLWAKFW
jgi:hypothetical protein